MILTWGTTNERFGSVLILSLLARLSDLAMLWSEPSGYLDIARSQSPVSQISSDLAGPADKTLHGKRKWQTAGDKRPDYESSVKRGWSQRLFKVERKTKKSCQEWKYTSCLFFSDLARLNLIWTLMARCCPFIWRNKSIDVPSFLTWKDKRRREHFLNDSDIEGWVSLSSRWLTATNEHACQI